MDSNRFIVAIVLSMVVLLGYSYLLPPSQQVQEETVVSSPDASAPEAQQSPLIPTVETMTAAPGAVLNETAGEPEQRRKITIDAPLYTAVIDELGGILTSFKLKKYKESLAPESDLKELVVPTSPNQMPLTFTWGVEPDRLPAVLFTADQDNLTVAENGSATLTMTAVYPGGILLTKTITFQGSSYLMDYGVTVQNTSEKALQGSPYFSMTNSPFSKEDASQFLFHGPAILQDGSLNEIAQKDIEKAGLTLSGNISWTAYEDTYFMYAVLPGQPTPAESTAHYRMAGDDKINTLLSGKADILQPGEEMVYHYQFFAGPKKLRDLKELNVNLEKIVDFGYMDILAKPVLHLLNFLYGFLHNFGLAIILVTVIIKILFWPIAQKGMKSMKTMQKLQPKMTKLREKYKDDRERLNVEMINLYKTYKVNPVGGCLPLLLQIPVFFALYRVLLQTIELRHAPFMLWITDLSMPDRLFIGFDIPYLGGLPVLTLLMGASMFLQQKMSPPPADPTQAKVMMFLPVIFTFMFLNFASGLVLYWFVNNLLSIAQQYLINRQMDAKPAAQ